MLARVGPKMNEPVWLRSHGKPMARVLPKLTGHLGLIFNTTCPNTVNNTQRNTLEMARRGSGLEAAAVQLQNPRVQTLGCC